MMKAKEMLLENIESLKRLIENKEFQIERNEQRIDEIDVKLEKVWKKQYEVQMGSLEWHKLEVRYCEIEQRREYFKGKNDEKKRTIINLQEQIEKLQKIVEAFEE